MKQLVRILYVVSFLVVSTAGIGQESASVTDLTWLAGCWEGETGEECWLPPKGGTLIGVNRGSDGGSFEFLRIVDGAGEGRDDGSDDGSDDGGVVYWASPGGACPATPFRAIEVADRRVVFANPEHDFPQKIAYWVDDAGKLHARVSAEVDGVDKGFELTWIRRGSW